MITKVLVLAMVLTITLAVTTPALGQAVGPSGVWVTDSGRVGKSDIGAGTCSNLGPNNYPKDIYSKSDFEKIVSLCEKKGFSVNGPPKHSQPQWKVTDNGVLVERTFSGLFPRGKCSNLPRQLFEAPPSEGVHPQEAVRACEKAGFSVNVERQTSLPKTGGPPVILVPIALLVVCGLLIRKSTTL
jgi:hypothetical protein